LAGGPVAIEDRTRPNYWIGEARGVFARQAIEQWRMPRHVLGHDVREGDNSALKPCLLDLAVLPLEDHVTALVWALAIMRASPGNDDQRKASDDDSL
jgi:hypothetical protein